MLKNDLASQVSVTKPGTLIAWMGIKLCMHAALSKIKRVGAKTQMIFPMDIIPVYTVNLRQPQFETYMHSTDSN